ncbi:5'-methylthioadenosine/adenosylhomocysteine nucleosidase [Azoarcus sp. DN11]|uniref:5'-methylthioadenosine/adenosylhomocysteine nucleosidase n=1 Tax=Azoarcus sp. DN11 TaxID=356837 RepID=UPI0013E2EDD7|nr:5'-methylthioadenosine/adenosylhomocysteine nucleosidase [Azoarcus sp. DN11]
MIIILGAMDSEIEEFLSRLSSPQRHQWNGFAQHRGQLEGQDVLVSKSGVGKVMSALVTQHLIDRWHPQAVIFTGLAGSLRPHIDIGDTLLAADLVQHDLESAGLQLPRGQVPYSDYRFMPADPVLLELAAGFVPATGKVHRGRICTGDQFITCREMDSHAYLTEELEGDGVEMEGASVALVCSVNRVPFLVARTISDRADGSAADNFEAFLPRASRNSLDLVRFLLPRIARAELRGAQGSAE